ncbi:hypothetical protein TRVL_00987 [Trypanosoma vivax]|uniref:Uncharacterized protein n=1 Tax=Trypanosoma vivax (strain Y486) TaxID=1055687 RepID=G0U1K2_TRYVY|nr:hypothetical protein TRVL_00987 [Trypanosoma vivax]CCC49959.1 hypothetical protein, unlikely [Trypanosoma vivax Y486]
MGKPETKIHRPMPLERWYIAPANSQTVAHPGCALSGKSLRHLPRPAPTTSHFISSFSSGHPVCPCSPHSFNQNVVRRVVGKYHEASVGGATLDAQVSSG